MDFLDPIRVLSVGSHPVQVLSIRSNMVRVLTMRSDPIRSGPIRVLLMPMSGEVIVT